MPTDAGLIDTHQHVVPDFYVKALATVGEDSSGERDLPAWNMETSLEVMERKGIRAIVASISSPGVFFGDIDFTKRLIPDCNEFMAKLQADHPGRLGTLGQVSLPDVEAACRDVEYALDSLGLDGISILAHMGDQYLGSPAYDELYAELDRRSAVLFVHPLRPPETGRPEYGFPAGMVELVFDTTRAIANMLYYGLPDRFPNIRFVMSHAGGTAPIIQTRLRRLVHNPDVAERLPSGVPAALAHLYYDVAQSAEPTALRALQDIAPADHILFGSDFPFARIGDRVIDETIDGIAGFDGFDAETRQLIRHDNAVRLFPRLAAT